MEATWYPSIKEGYDFDGIMETLPEWNDDYQKDGLVAFKGANLTSEQLAKVFRAVGHLNNFTPSGDTSVYNHDPDFATVEGHGDFAQGAQLYYDTHHATKGANMHNGWSAICPDVPVAIQWHLENSHRLWPQIAAGWTVPFKTCPSGEGCTGFVDVQALFPQIPEDIQEILLTMPTIIEYPSAFANRWDAMHDLLPSAEFTAVMRESCNELGEWGTDSNGYSCEVRAAVIPHPVTGIPCLRTIPFSVRQGALREEDEALWDEVRFHIRRVFQDPQNVVWWDWDTSDFLMVDLFRMAHGVGAFPGGTRTLRGVFGYDPAVDFDNFSTQAPAIASPNEEYPLPVQRPGTLMDAEPRLKPPGTMASPPPGMMGHQDDEAAAPEYGS